jgi:hypothetical protein
MEKKNKDPVQKGRKKEKNRKNVHKTTLFFDVFIERIRLNIQRTQRETMYEPCHGLAVIRPRIWVCWPQFPRTGYFLARLRPFKKRILRREKGIQKV